MILSLKFVFFNLFLCLVPFSCSMKGIFKYKYNISNTEQAGLTAADVEIADWLRKNFSDKPIILAVNKCESPRKGTMQALDFWSLGWGLMLYKWPYLLGDIFNLYFIYFLLMLKVHQCVLGFFHLLSPKPGHELYFEWLNYSINN